MRLAAAIGTAWGTASVLAAMLVGRAARLRDGIPQPVADRMLTVPGLPQEPPPHAQPCIDPVFAVLDGEKRLSLVPMLDGRMAVFAADMSDFVGLTISRSDVQNMVRTATRYLCDTARTVTL